MIKSKLENIPLILHKTGENYLNSTTIKLFDFFSMSNPSVRVEYYTASMRRIFIQIHFDNDVLDAYDQLNSVYYKIELFKYCLLYIKGGIYGDLEQQYLASLSKIIDLTKDLCLTAKSEKDPNIIGLSFIAAKPKLQLFLDVINTCVTNIKNKDYGNEPNDITGSNVFTTIFEKHKNHLNYEFSVYETKNSLNNIKTNQAIIDKKINGFTRLKQKMNNQNYIREWNSKKVFLN